MARAITAIEADIRALSVSDKEALLRVLWEELDGAPDAAVDAAWLDEAQRRAHEIDEGLVKCVPADEVFAKAEQHIRK